MSAGLDTVALRAPSHLLAQKLIAEAGVPLAAPSANPSGRVSPTSAAHVEEGLGGKIDLILDGGITPGGVPSTVVDCTIDELHVLRCGAISEQDLRDSLAENS